MRRQQLSLRCEMMKRKRRGSQQQPSEFYVHLNWINMSSMIAFDVRFIFRLFILWISFLSFGILCGSVNVSEAKSQVASKNSIFSFLSVAVYFIQSIAADIKWVYTVWYVYNMHRAAARIGVCVACVLLCVVRTSVAFFFREPLVIRIRPRSLRNWFRTNRFFSFELASNASGLRNVVDWSRCDI